MSDPDPTPASTTTVTSSPVAATSATTVKPGWQTSEFWLKVIATGLSALFASGLITSNTALAIAGIAAAELGSFGYTVLRTNAKAV